MATFSCWTIGPANISKSGHLFGKDYKIGISPVHSWMNFILTTGIAIFNFTDFHLSSFSNSHDSYDSDTICFTLLITDTFAPAMPLAILVTMIFLLHGDYISYIYKCDRIACCYCSQITNCNSNQFTFLNTETMEEEFPIQESSSTNQTSPTNMCSCICSSKYCRNWLSYFFAVLLLFYCFFALFSFFFLGFWGLGPCYDDD